MPANKDWTTKILDNGFDRGRKSQNPRLNPSFVLSNIMKSNESIQHRSLTRDASPEAPEDRFTFDGMKINKYLSRNHAAAQTM